MFDLFQVTAVWTDSLFRFPAAGDVLSFLMTCHGIYKLSSFSHEWVEIGFVFIYLFFLNDDTLEVIIGSASWHLVCVCVCMQKV